METTHCPISSLPIPSFFSNQQAQTRRKQVSISKHWQPLHSRPQLRAHALNNALTTAANSTASGGDISVLLPVSAVLFFVYWIANFVVPDLITKGQQPKDTYAEEAPGLQSNISDTEEDSMPGQPQQKIKNSTVKKITTSR